MMNVEVLVSLSLTPPAFNSRRTRFINAEFANIAPVAVLLVVSTPNDSVTVSGFTLVDAVPITEMVVRLAIILFLGVIGLVIPVIVFVIVQVRLLSSAVLVEQGKFELVL